MLRNNKIPKKFKLLGQTISVVLDQKYFEEAGYFGYASYRTNEIRLRPVDSEERLAATFWHELTHFVLYFSGVTYKGKEEYMFKDEEFVDLTANLFHQAVSTMEF